ncbi:BatD family protein [Zunongwangia sp. HRR-M8]|uniref:BatD family protein n=1 Tax=Zunongwangia sp. HRR-M8 TaxID=3015170 RepID=UPI0022DD51B6|nr:BatD family protein [Zunongwangia sp. HRR-M8]WBL22193.1 BatD family protein [Zunongwangia sp. HRR-M8]
MKKNQLSDPIYKQHAVKKRLSAILVIAFAFFAMPLVAQQAQVSAKIDTAQIKIGEQISYKINVETDSTNLVVFPEGNTFAPLEIVESLGTDTTRVQNKYQLFKEYTLTQFDSGSYTIPQQKIIINNKPFLTDSMRVEVADVAVDTTKQEMYPIKPSVEIPKSFSVPNWIWWLLLVLVILGVLAFFFIKRRREKALENKLPPYEQAMKDLEDLDKSTLIENREVKEYYSRLTYAIRRYLDEKVYDGAMESTTTELIEYLEIQQKSGVLQLHGKTLDNLKQILQRADLAKFAGSRPDVITAKEDRNKSRMIINDVKSSMPEPTEEELMQDEEYRQNKLSKRRKKRLILGVSGGVLVVFIALAVLISSKGLDYVVDTYWGHPTKELLEGDWIRSEYGTPAVYVTTPDVLVRRDMELSEDAIQSYVDAQMFSFGSLVSNFYTSLNTRTFSKKDQFDLKTGVDGVYKELENQGAQNIVMKQEDFTTVNGAKGVKVFGTLEMTNPVNDEIQPKKYSILNFAQNGGFQQITVIYNEDDSYAEEISGRIINSVELIKSTN